MLNLECLDVNYKKDRRANIKKCLLAKKCDQQIEVDSLSSEQIRQPTT